ncbi:hypothetical protein MSAN_01827400 [Mycena sanguinolenta]|uniref:F-box domain-containing protein n=1 Tax=Mycena sanguinolenta TaxID=230812 RepID=A0A8H7CQ37_9AGAR|nr:hypothetical protein MSAN_01827400 [Mycena sanguinolenta]
MATASSFSVRATLEKAREYSKAELERRVEESKMKIKSLETQPELRDRECAVLAVMKYLLSPIYAMPAELLAEIFERAIDEETHIEDVFRMSQVCSDWRQVAHNTPQLWTGPLYVTLDNKGDKREQAHTDGWKAWLARSAALPIPITLALESADIYHDLLGEVLKTAFRWRSFQLDFPSHGLLLLRRVAQHALDSLEELDLGDRDFFEPLGGVIPTFTSAPRLRKLKMCIFSSPPILVPWANLTDLTLRYCSSPDVALDVLAPCLGLTRLSVRTLGWPVPPRARQDTLTLTHLHTLSFALFGTAKNFAPFFGNLSAPALQELWLNFGGMQGWENWTETTFTTFQLQAPNITRLDLEYADLTSDEFRAVLLHAPSLTHLKLFRCSCFDDATMTALRYKEGIATLVPRLHNLVLEGMVHRVSDDILAEMIASRWWTNAALASDSPPPAAACWTRVELWYDLSEHSFLKDIPSDILMTSTRSHSGRDHFLFE